MKRISIGLAAFGLFALGCDKPSATQPRIAGSSLEGGVVHRVSVGSHDIVPPGTDANFSLIALAKGDGTMTGEWTDQFGHGNGGVHVDVDCVEVLGNEAWISGVITHSQQFEGLFALTRVQDNGTSEHEPPDQISFTFILANPVSCHLRPALPLFPLTGGEVKVD
jgi:hypothetical protein